jgi:hypothetical protein
MAHIGEAVAVLVDQEGAPVRFRWREKTYLVVTRPVRYFTRLDWWTGEKASKGIGPSSLELEMWQVFASSDGIRSSCELVHNSETHSWKLNNLVVF